MFFFSLILIIIIRFSFQDFFFKRLKILKLNFRHFIKMLFLYINTCIFFNLSQKNTKILFIIFNSFWFFFNFKKILRKWRILLQFTQI